MSDGNLRQLFQRYMPTAHWQPVETFSTGHGVPDVEYCFPPSGASGWIENKLTRGWTVDLRPHQVAWLERRTRAGGRCFVAVRRRTAKVDEIYLFLGAHSRQLMEHGMRGLESPEALLQYAGGPASWHWRMIQCAIGG